MAVRCVEFIVDLFIVVELWLFLASVEPPVQELLLLATRFVLIVLSSRGGIISF